jgi:hypothetical protein
MLYLDKLSDTTKGILLVVMGIIVLLYVLGILAVSLQLVVLLFALGLIAAGVFLIRDKAMKFMQKDLRKK